MIGGALEKPAAGAVIGSTFACVLAMQFANLKKSDRYVENSFLLPLQTCCNVGYCGLCKNKYYSLSNELLALAFINH